LVHGVKDYRIFAASPLKKPFTLINAASRLRRTPKTCQRRLDSFRVATWDGVTVVAHPQRMHKTRADTDGGATAAAEGGVCCNCPDGGQAG